jgi:RNA polymerase sigma factor FliA
MNAPRTRISRDKLIEEYQPYVHYVATRLMKSLGLPSEQFDEFVAAGYLGLVEAAERFDFKSGVSFKNFAYLRIRGAIIDGLRNCSQLSGRAYRFAKALEAAQDLREVMSEDDWRKISQQKSGHSKESLGKILEYATKGALVYRLSFADAPAEVSEMRSEAGNPETLLQEKQSTRFLKEAVSALPPKEQEIVDEYYFQGKPFCQIAQEKGGLSKSWVSRLHSRAIEKIKKRCFEELS